MTLAEPSAGKDMDLSAARCYSSFFNRLVDLIPAKYYRSPDDGAHVDLQHMNKADKAAAQRGFKAKAKASKRAKLAALSGGAEAAAGGDGALGAAPSGADAASPPAASTKASAQQAPLLNIPTENVSRAELREKLQQRLKDLKQQRQQVDKLEAVKKAKDWKRTTLEQNAMAKQQQQEQQQKKQKQKPAAQQQKGTQKGQKRAAEGDVAPAGPSKKHAAAEQPAAQAPPQGSSPPGLSGLAFPRIEVDGEGRHKGGAKKLSKEVQLKIAEAKQKERLEAEKSEGGKQKLAQEVWKSALLRASGDKVLDDPKLLRKSLKKEAKRKEKSSKVWKERVHAQEEEAAAKQNKRKEHLQSRIQGHVDKKKAQREKKLLRAGDAGKANKAPRAGFEGRRTEFIGGAKAAPKKS